MQKIDKLRKFAEGGKVRKYQDGQTMEGGDLTDLVSEKLAQIQERRAKSQARREAFSKENGTSTVMQVGGEAIDMAGDALVGDKNFGAQSEAIDGAVDMTSDALMKSGNLYAMGAAVALKGINFLTKIGGRTVPGFDVDINSSGYGNLGHMDSYSSRGLFGIETSGMRRRLAKRNEQAKMAINAANIANEQSFEQEARANSIQNTIMNNNIALAGGLHTSLLGG